MKNPTIGQHESEDIQQQVRKILRGLGNPEPPLNLDDVRNLLELDRRFYSTSNDSGVREKVSRIIVAGKQVLRRPMILIDAIRKVNLAALWLPDRREILLDKDKPVLKHRWSEAHEIGHAITPWHPEFLLGDSESELSPSCHATIEAEANYAAGQLLFLHERFSEEAADSERSIDGIQRLKKRYGNTLTSTLWRFVEEDRTDRPLVGVVSPHPLNTGVDFDPTTPCRYMVQSPAFRARFSNVTEVDVFRSIGGYVTQRRRGPVGEGEVVLTDDNGERHEFRFESFSNTYDVLTLGSYVRKLSALAAVS